MKRILFVVLLLVPLTGLAAQEVPAQEVPSVFTGLGPKISRHPRDLEHPLEVRLGMHEGDGPVLDWKKEIHQHGQTRGVDETLLIEGQDDLV